MVSSVSIYGQKMIEKVLLLLVILLFLFAAIPFLVTPAIANPPNESAQKGPLNIKFEKGLFSIHSDGASLGKVLAEIEKSSGFTISIDEGLKAKPVSIQSSGLDIIKTLRVITTAAGLGGYGISYKSTDVPGRKMGQWTVDKITMVNPGDDPEILAKGGPAVKQRYENSEPTKRPKTFDKEPFFDKRLNRYIEVAKGEVLVRFSKEISQKEIKQFHKENGTQTIKGYEKIGAHLLKIPATQTVQEFIEKHSIDNKQVYVEPVFLTMKQAVIVNDPSFNDQWSIPQIQADRAWEINSGNPDMVVAVIDTGIDRSHADLKNNVISGIDIVNGISNGMDDNGHGTYIAGIIAAEANNSVGIAGISWKSRLMPVKVLNASGEGKYSDLIEGIIYAVDHGARVLNLSLGGYSYSQFLEDAVQYAHSNRAVIVAAGGNENTNELLYPAAYPNVIGVSATDSSDQRWFSSNYGTYTKLSAPGVGVISTLKNNSYGEATGTSVSTAHVSGVAALILSKNPDLSNTQVENILFQTADDLGDKGWDNYYGFGRVNALRAIEKAGIAVHDVAVTGIRIDPETFKVGEAAKIIVTVENQGTFAERALEVSTMVDNAVVEESKKIGTGTINPGDTIEITFTWVPMTETNAIIEIASKISAVSGESDLNDNNKKISLSYVYNTESRVVALYSIIQPVHQWIAFQAYNKLLADAKHSAIINEMKNYLPRWETSAYYSTDINNPAYPEMLRCNSITPSLCTDDLQAPSESISAIVEGAFEEDLDVINATGKDSSNFCYDSHYWDPDRQDISDPGMPGSSCNNALRDALDPVRGRWVKALNYYSTKEYDKAYYWLGRTAHLLMDMSVPAHTLLDKHTLDPALQSTDDYEDYAGENYKSIDFKNTDIPDLLDPDLESFTVSGEYGDNGGNDVGVLFYNLAQISNDFDSDDKDGESYQFGKGKYTLKSESLDINKTVSRVELWKDNTWPSPNELLYTMIRYNKNEENSYPIKKDGQPDGPHYDIFKNNNKHYIFYYRSFYDHYNPIQDKNVFIKITYTDGTHEDDDAWYFNEDIDDEVLKDVYQPLLQGEAIGYVAALYKLFWNETHPHVDYFSVNPTSITTGSSVNISYSVSAGSGLKQVELWRTNDIN